jgi:hypothetical protein
MAESPLKMKDEGDVISVDESDVTALDERDVTSLDEGDVTSLDEASSKSGDGFIFIPMPFVYHTRGRGHNFAFSRVPGLEPELFMYHTGYVKIN